MIRCDRDTSKTTRTKNTRLILYMHRTYCTILLTQTRPTVEGPCLDRVFFFGGIHTIVETNTMRVDSSLVQSSPTMGTDTVSTHSNTRQQDKTKNNSCINPTYVLRERERERESDHVNIDMHLI